ncbi:MAG TPA: hypothetical protein VG795_09875, partial [Acidimicrobiia bacterium]|nr:hypothetical protein [Acidimicrobiia bacterium]
MVVDELEPPPTVVVVVVVVVVVSSAGVSVAGDAVPSQVRLLPALSMASKDHVMGCDSSDLVAMSVKGPVCPGVN